MDDLTAVLSYRRRVNHVLHAILTLFTLGLWLLVWIPMAVSNKETRVTLTVDDAGILRSDRPMFVAKA
jgi:hypothetical protein